MPRRILVGRALAGPLLCFVAAHPVTAQTTTFPVRIDSRSPATLQTAGGGLNILTDSHYQNRIALDVAPQTAEPILRVIAPEADTTLALHVTAFSTKSGSAITASIRETYSFYLHTSSDTWGFISVDGTKTSDEIEVEWQLTQEQDRLILYVTTPFEHSRLTLFLEVLASKAVTIAELY